MSGQAFEGRCGSAMRIAAATLALALVALITFVQPTENDFWLQARIGQWIVETGEIPRTVLFPFTEVSTRGFNAHEWLPSIVFHALDSFLGYDRLVFALGALGALLFALTFAMVFTATRSLAWSLLLSMLALATANYRHVLRPELFALIVFTALLLVLDRLRTSGNWNWLACLLPIGVLWANSHGSFVLGPIVASIFALGQAMTAARSTGDMRGPLVVSAASPFLAAAALLVTASLINPLGIGLWDFVFKLSASQVAKEAIYEWSPTLSARFMSKLPFFIFLAAASACAFVVVKFRERTSATEWLLLAAFAVLALQRLRFVVFFGFVAAFVCAQALRHRTDNKRERVLLSASLVVSSVGIALVLSFGNARGDKPYHSESLNFTEPMLARLMRPGMHGHVLNSYELGAELVYRAYPRLKPSIDSRIDSYGDDYFMQQTTMLVDEPRLNAFLDRYNVQYMLLLWRDFNYLKDMRSLQQRGWRMDFADHKAVLLTRAAK